MLDRIGNPGVFRHGLVRKVDPALFVQRDILEERISADRPVDIRLGLLVEVYDLRIAAALKVKDALVVPAVLIISDQKTLRIRGEGRLARPGETEEDRSMLSVQVRVRGAVHGCDALQRQVVVHHAEDALLHFPAVPGIDDDLLPARDIEKDRGLGVQAELPIIFKLRLRGIVDDEVRLEILKLLLRRIDEHIRDEVSLPGDLHDEADRHPRLLAGTAEGVHDEESLSGKLPLRKSLRTPPGLLRRRMVVVRIALAGPPDRVL